MEENIDNDQNLENDEPQNNGQNTTHQQSLVNDSFSTIERLEVEMSEIENEFHSLDVDKKD